MGIFGSGDALYQDFAVKTFRIYLSLVTATCLTKMTALFFQSIEKSISAVIASVIRDIICFIPMALLLPVFLKKSEAGTGIIGFLYAAPISDIVAIIVVFILTVKFFKTLDREPKSLN